MTGRSEAVGGRAGPRGGPRARSMRRLAAIHPASGFGQLGGASPPGPQTQSAPPYPGGGRGRRPCRRPEVRSTRQLVSEWGPGPSRELGTPRPGPNHGAAHGPASRPRCLGRLGSLGRLMSLAFLCEGKSQTIIWASDRGAGRAMSPCRALLPRAAGREMSRGLLHRGGRAAGRPSGRAPGVVFLSDEPRAPPRAALHPQQSILMRAARCAASCRTAP